MDNTYENLARVIESSEPQQPRIGRSGFLGVTRRGEKYTARVTVNRVEYWLGTFDSPEEAAAAVEAKRNEAIEFYKEGGK